MTAHTTDRTTRMTTLDHVTPKRSAASPFFVAATGMTIALFVIAALVAIAS
ncbi:hypothetical protein BH09ACT5_BH09ACT5_24870 [soil metagenome]